MATLTLSTSFDNWPPNAISGGVIQTRSGVAMTYVSDAGYSVTLRGTGFAYDDDGMASGGNVTRVVITQGGQTYADYTGVSVDLGIASMQIFGFDRTNGNQQQPDPYSFLEHVLRGNDLMTGSVFSDQLMGTKGNDTINGGAGRDQVGGEQGNDVMDGGTDQDRLYYDMANGSWEAFRGVNLDAVTGIAIDPWGDTDHFTGFEEYADTAYGDTMKGSAADEYFGVTRGNDVIDGRGGFDFVSYEEATNVGGKRGIKVNLDTGKVIDSWKGTDTLSGIEGVKGTAFNDTMIGSQREDTFGAGAGKDSYDGAGGRDWLVFWDLGQGNNDGAHGVTIDLTRANQIMDDGFGNVETAVGIEVIDGSRFGDTVTGGNTDNWLYGGEGNDVLSGLGGNDELAGGDGDDQLAGGVGNDVLFGGTGLDRLTGNQGADDFNFFQDVRQGGVDVITDMQVGTDDIRVLQSWGGLTGGDITAAQFRSGAGVTSANTTAQRFVYNSTTGDLYFDADGSGGSQTVLFARLENHVALTFADIQVL